MTKRILIIIAIGWLTLASVAYAENYALSFDGADDCVEVPYNASLNISSGDFTIEAWVKRSATNTRHNILERNSGDKIITLYVHSDNKVYGNTYADASNSTGVISTSTATVGTDWTHIAFVRSGTAHTLYINGFADSSTTGTIRDVGVNASLYIGRLPGGGENFNGLMDEIRIWNTARTEAEIKANMYKEIATPIPDNLKAYYKMNENTGATLTDNSNTGTINGTINGGATWVPSFYTITYDGNSNTGGTAPDTQIKTHGVSLPLATQGSLERTGYTFAGWTNNSGTDYAAGSSYELNAALTLYAKWTQIQQPPTVTTYTVTYDANGADSGSVPIDNTPYAQGATVTVLGIGTLAKSGYTFAGWNTASDGSGTTTYQSADTFTMGTANITLYAQWTPAATYTVTYNANGADVATSTPPTDSNTYAQGATVTVLGTGGSLARTGHTFAGWNTASDGNGTPYQPAATFSMGTANITLYAKWIQPPTVTTTAITNITLNSASSGGNVTSDGGSAVTARGICWGTSSNPTVPTVNATSDGTGTGTFTSNLTGLIASTTYYVRAYSTNSAGTAYGADTTFTTSAAVTTYTVTYNANVATSGSAPNTQTKIHDQPLTLATNTGNLVRTGFGFAGWNTQPDGLGTNYAAGGSYTANASITLYAKWTPYVLNNGKLKFGSGENSVNSTGNLQQPFYYNNGWQKLTIGANPLNFSIAIDGDGIIKWNRNGSRLDDPILTGRLIDTSYFSPTEAGLKGYGTIISTGIVTILPASGTGSKNLEIKNTYELLQGKSYVTVTTRIRNISGSSVSNVRYWVGTRDDWVGSTDRPRKEKGNLVDGAFAKITNAADGALAIKITTGSEGVLFYTDSNKANTIISSCCSWTNVIDQNPQTSTIDITSDGSYGFYVRLNDLANGASDEFTWYYAAGSTTDLATIINDVASASGAVSDITHNSAKLTATSDVNGTGYWIVVAKDATAPTNAEIEAATTYSGVTVVASGGGDGDGDGDGVMTANVAKEFSITGLQPATNYDLYFVIKDGSNVYSTPSKSPFITKLISPTGVTATAGNTSAVVSWTASSGATTYRVTGSPSGSCTATAPTTTCTVTGLTNGTAYTFTVTASNGSATSLASSPSSPVTPSPTYTVTYNGNSATGGTPPTDSNTYAQGATVTVGNSGTIVKTGYIFKGWNTTSTGIGTTYQPGITFPMSGSNVTLYAIWEVGKYNITISNTTSSNGSWLDQSPNIKVWTATDNNATISVTDIQTSLNDGKSVIITNSNTGLEEGDINITSPIITTKTIGAESTPTLTLAARRNIIINSPISGSSGSPLNVVLSARGFAGAVETTLGDVKINANIKTYGGNITIGGGDSSAAGYAIASGVLYSVAGVNVDSGVLIDARKNSDNPIIIDATSDASGVVGNTIPTADSGGNITIRGKGNINNSTDINWGFGIFNSLITTGGSGTISIDGFGGLSNGYHYSVSSAGVAIEGNSYIKSKSGNITIKGTAGTGYDQYGIAVTGGTTNNFIGTNGTLILDGSSLLIRDGTLAIYGNSNIDIKPAIVGCTEASCTNFTLSKSGNGALNISGNAQSWSTTPPTTTSASSIGNTFQYSAGAVNAVTPNTLVQGLYAFTNTGLSFDGIDDYVSIADNDQLDLTSTSSYTIEAWIKPKSFKWLGGIVGKYHTSGANGYTLRLSAISSSDATIPSYSGINFDEMSTANGILTVDQWQHIAAVNNNGTRELYVNGIKQTLSGSPTTIANNTNPLVIGADYLTGGARYFDGLIDEVRIWNVARSQTDITNNMYNELAGTESGLVAYYKMNEGSGTSLNDRSTKTKTDTNTGVLVGPTWVVSDSLLPRPFTVTGVARQWTGTGGTVQTVSSVNKGETPTLTITPNPGYTISTVTGCGGSLSGDTYTTGAVTAPCTVTATFSLNNYKVTGTVQSVNGTTGGTITPSDRTVQHGGTATFTVTPDWGYEINSVTAGTGCSGTLSGNIYTIGNDITDNCTVTATFKKRQYEVTGVGIPLGIGSISPSTQFVDHGSTATFTVTHSPGYSINYVLGCNNVHLTSSNGNTYTYTTGTITGPCKVIAFFR